MKDYGYSVTFTLICGIDMAKKVSEWLDVIYKGQMVQINSKGKISKKKNKGLKS